MKKMENFSETLFTKKNILSHLPRRIDNPLVSSVIFFTTTNECNLRCRYCYNLYCGTSEKLDPDVAIGFLKAYLVYQKQNNIDYPLREITFSGGEPTLNPDVILKVMNYVHENNIHCLPKILTN